MNQKQPFYIKITLLLVGLYAFVILLILGKDIFIPLIYATICAILLNPLVNYLTKKKLNRVVSIFIVVVFFSSLLAVVFYLIIYQISSLNDAIPVIKIKIDELKNIFIQLIVDNSNLHKSEILQWIENSEKKEIYHFSITKKLNQMSQILIAVFLIPIYLILILYYKPLFSEFIKRLFQDKHQTTISEVLINTKKIVQKYLIGLMIEMLIIFVLYFIVLILLDIKYAILLAFIAALMNMIPFVGGITGVLLCFLMAIVTKSTSSALYLLIIFSAIQLIDKNILVPKIIVSSVQINAFISLIVVIISAAIWGIHGMFLSIPLTAIMKVIFDHNEALSPLGFLLGNNVTPSLKSEIHKSMFR